MTQFANQLAPMKSEEIAELVCENGNILMRGRSTNPSYISYSFQSKKAQAMSNHGGEIRPRLSLNENQVSSNYKMDQIPDYQSEAHPVNRSSGSAPANTFKRKAADDTEKSVDQLPSIYSIGASNDEPCYSSERIDEDSESTSSPTSDHNEEDEEQVSQPVLTAKRRRTNPEIHDLSERERRDKINKKMRALQALIPNSDNVDKASMLDNAIEYLKSLQFQLQWMMGMGSRLCMAPMMLATRGLAMQQLQAANMMGMRMANGVGFCPNAPMLLPVLQPPFIPLIGGSSALLPIPCNSGSILDLMSTDKQPES